MKLKNLLLGMSAVLAVLTACTPEEVDLGTPNISIDKNEMVFEMAGGDSTLTVSATRDWKLEADADWVTVSPASGVGSLEPQTVTVTALENTGMDRSTDLAFTIGMKRVVLTVSQAGPGGSPEALILYYNDFDKVEATKTYGSGSSWPYLDQFDGWKNATGTGAANVEYTSNGMSARANSTSNSNYSDYAGSGKNNMFFGASAYFATKNIALNGATGMTLTFGTEKYSQDNGSVFQNSEFHIFLSQDGAKWVELTDYTFAGGETEGRWNIATANFSVPEGTENLSICMQVDVASSYRMDDMKLVISEGGATVDFSNAAEKDFGKPTGGNQGGGESDGTAIYSNNYDKEAATKTYGSGSSWPYLDQFEGWKNAAGTGAANVSYTFSGASARNNSNSNGSYSDYAGSGMNNIFFGTNAYFSTNNIALNGATDLTLTFGTEKYSQENGKVFTNSEYHIWLSADGNKWVELTDYTFAGGTKEGRWNVATANFTVPAGTANLSICMQVDVASSYRMDDFKLVAGTEAGTVIDFTQGVEKDFTEGGTSGGESTTTPESKGKKTVAEFIAAADANNYYELTGTVSGFNPTYCSFDLTDETGKIYVYSVLDASKSEWASKIANGGTVTIYGKYLYYEQKSQHEVVDAYIESYTPGEGGDKDPAEGQPTDLTKATIAEFLAAAESSDVWYELTGEIISIAKETYGNFTIKDETGEVYIYGMTSKWVGSNDQSFSLLGLKVGDVVTLGTLRGSYNGTPQGGGNPVPAFYISHVAGEGGNEGEEDPVTPPAGGEGQYESNITWTLGTNAYDNTSSGTNAQSAVVNGVTVSNLLKIGTGSKVGDATLHIPAGTTKLGFYCVAWKGKKAEVKFSVGGTEIATINPAANVGATGNAPYKELNVAESDYYKIEISATEATDVKVETLDPSNGRALFIGFKAE